eukprot:NODE_411_length_7931_cov_0.531920.p5 type:complete len:161 gc:universal NODE_411_length_7931_cov_0.531920:4254-4736(+)
MLQSSSFENFDNLEKIACIMLVKLQKGDLRVDSKEPSVNNLYRLSKESDEDSVQEKRKTKSIRSSPSKSRSIEKLDQIGESEKSCCSLCLRTFNRKYELERHLKTVHVEPVKCAFCLKNLKLMNRKDMQKKHLMFRCNEFISSGQDIDMVDLDAVFTRVE